MPRRFEHKVAIVTAAAAGIGQAIAIRLAEEGAALVLADLAPLDDTCSRVGADCVIAQARIDCTDSIAVDRFCDDVLARTPVDILVNGVGSSARGRAREFCDSEPEVWNFVIATSLTSAMLVTRRIAPHMRQRRSGKILNISTDAWLYPNRRFADYAAAKAGLVGFTRTLALELADAGVNVNAISPGPIAAGGTAQLPPDMLAEIAQSVPMRRLGEVAEVAALAAFLVADESAYITGQNIAINGGRTMN